MEIPGLRNQSPILINLAVAASLVGAVVQCRGDERFKPVAIKSHISRVQPMTGIVLWTTSEHHQTDAVQLEYSYMKYGDVVTGRDQYDWCGGPPTRRRRVAQASGDRSFLFRLSGTPDDRPRVHQTPRRLSRIAEQERGETHNLRGLVTP